MLPLRNQTLLIDQIVIQYFDVFCGVFEILALFFAGLMGEVDVLVGDEVDGGLHDGDVGLWADEVVGGGEVLHLDGF